jgi:hypothetical protein
LRPFLYSEDNLHQMKLHIKEHSYRDAKYKCEVCDFCGDSFLTMEVHNKTYLSENLECGLCEFQVKDKFTHGKMNRKDAEKVDLTEH